MNNLVNMLKDFYDFKQTVILLREDLIATVKELYFSHLENEDYYFHDYFKRNNSESVLTFNFLDRDIVRFIWIFIKINPERIYSKGFENICKDLNVDIRFPLILTYGVIEPIDLEKIRNDPWPARDWGFQLLKLTLEPKYLEEMKFPEKYDYDTEIYIETDFDDDRDFKKAKFKIKRLTDIKNQEDLKKIAEDLKNLSF